MKIKIFLILIIFSLTIKAQIKPLKTSGVIYLYGSEFSLPVGYQLFITSVGDTLKTSDSTYFLVPLSYMIFKEFKKGNQNEKIIINSNYFFAVLFERKRSSKLYI